ncbi:hypothetical protein CCAX7_55240 [Capsulimonas corticalis]|uniref:Uncharacterized protein n=1 Tax=Capsulimonas corticalis TaxID=2219043 RepID=A0A402D5N4_9BACT|nr:recombinase family protein [Capsulimonas corticalis]BDI33473.1 hypothetical protein CCAX7_55240 [Capsulimonas corticalis]
MTTRKQVHLSFTPLRYCIYRRVSKESQVERDLSLPEQEAQQIAYVAARGGVVTHNFQDGGISAWGEKGDQRAEFQKAITCAKAGEYDVFLIHKSDRVFRYRTHAVTYKHLLKQYGVKVESVTEPWVGGDDPSEKLIEGVMECVSEFHSDNLSTELKKGIHSAAANKGRQHGPPVYGYRYAEPGVRGAGWALDDEAARWVKWIFETYVGQRAMLVDLARQLNAMKIRPPGTNGARRNVYLDGWQAQTISHMLRNIVYTGQCKLNGDVFPGAHPAIITAETFAQAQILVEARRPGKISEIDAMFAGGLLLCPHCVEAGRKSVLHTHIRSPKTGKREACYVCSVRMGMYRAKGSGLAPSQECPGFNIMEGKIRRMVIESLERIRNEGGIVELLAEHPHLAERLLEPPPLEAPSPHPDPQIIRKELDLIPTRIMALSDQNQRGYITLDQMGNAIAEIERTKTLLLEQLAIAETARPLKLLKPFDAHRLLVMIQSNQHTTEEKRAFLQDWLAGILVSADKKLVDFRIPQL